MDSEGRTKGKRKCKALTKEMTKKVLIDIHIFICLSIKTYLCNNHNMITLFQTL